MFSSQNQGINIMYANGNYPFVLARHEKKLDSCHERSSSCFNDELWFLTNQRVEMLFFFWGNQGINIVYPNGNYPFVLAHRKKKLDSCYERSSSRFKDKLWFSTNRRVELLFSWNQGISIMYPNGNYPFVLALREKKKTRFDTEILRKDVI